MVLRSFEEYLPDYKDHADFYFLDLKRYRETSNAVADRFGVRHESPQLLVVREGTVVVHESHGAINQVDLNAYFNG